MPDDEKNFKQRLTHRFSRHSRPLNRLPSGRLPERLRYGEDANDDVTAPARGAGVPQQYMNQSIFSMIAAAGSKTDFHQRFDESSDSEEEDEQPKDDRPTNRQSLERNTSARAARRPGDPSVAAERYDGKTETAKPGEKKRYSLPKLHPKHGKTRDSRSVYIDSPAREHLSQSKLSRTMTPRDAPMMSRMLEAQAQLSTSGFGSGIIRPPTDEVAARKRSESSPETLLSTRLMEIFGFENPEEVVSEYPCWLLQSVLLQGYLYITEKHLCFYAYLPKKSNVVAKSGYLSKRGRQHLRYHRYWFTLKGDVMSYYNDPSDLYFPSGNIDLRYGISAKPADNKDKTKESKDFSVTTDHRTYHFRADSAASAKEWVKNLQKVIFRSHNEGDSVKISLPIENIIDLEESPVIDFADTFKVRVVEGEESYAIDEFRSRCVQNIAGVDRQERPKVAARLGFVFCSNWQFRPTEASPVGSDRLVPDEDQRPGSSQALQDIIKAGSYPLQRAAGFAEYLKNRSKKMSTLLASESMGYYEKVSGMWAGGHKHYGENEGIMPDDNAVDPEDEEESVGHGDRFRTHFALPPSEKLQATYFGFLHRVLPLYGKIYISNRKFCFRSLLPGTKTKLILPLKDIENVDKEKGFRLGYHGLVLVIRGHEELFFEFNTTDHRDDCAITLLQNLESVKYLSESGLLAEEERAEAEQAKLEHKMLQEARQAGHASHDLKLPQKASDTDSTPSDTAPVLFDDPRASIINFRPTESLRVTCLTIGSRGDVQPYIALCKGLIADGHRARIATHAEFGPWVRKHGIEFKPVEGDPAELMRICVENGMFTYSFLKEASAKFRTWIDDLLSSAWEACKDSDLLIESPSAMAGIHIAEALGIPYFRAFTMPWTRTRAYPHAFAVPEKKIGGAYNYFSYVMFDNVFWKAIAGQVNRWRKRELGLGSTNLDRMQPNKVPFLYNFSPQVVVPPLDYSDWVRVTGYWFLDEGSDYRPPQELMDFINNTRKDGKKLVYIGFGSIVVSDPAALTKTVVDSVLKADVRCILSKGWSDRLGDPAAVKTEVPLPPEIHQIKSAPHDWLFRQIDAAAHHGGAGTTGASLRAGVPTIIKPFFGDQFFFGSRVEDLGVGICMKKVNVSVFSRALWEACHSERMIAKARVLGEEIRKENGVQTAIQAIYRDLEYAKTLVKRRQMVTKSDSPEKPQFDDELQAIEESWTFIGDEADPELAKRIRDFDMKSYAEARSSTISRQRSERKSGRGDHE
ncbi:putative udp-glucose:sterol glycosyltransferase [Phaeomoniella chlamydospora]|uniref:Sterol 3-beta-glucosyltransferase n=1 Tax=Phaeomoniella chlamydospora TaxID=158046 RepID=A0A0G2F1K2_PHACM|nr:putative udp-glucose:sterol glycosyltransferase [Phaeomoniella chlamydospora]